LLLCSAEDGSAPPENQAIDKSAAILDFNLKADFPDTTTFPPFGL
jgi:hypothetical protein